MKFVTTKANLEPLADIIMDFHDADNTITEITEMLIIEFPESNLDSLKNPTDAVRRFITRQQLVREEDEKKQKLDKKINSNNNVAKAKAILGEQEDTEEAKLRDELITERARRVEAERLLRGYNDRAAVEDRIASFLTKHIQANPYKPRLAMPKRSKTSRSIDSGSIEMMLLVSDAHFPEVVDPVEAMGLAYGPEIARKRMEHLVERTVRLMEVQGASAPVGKLTVAVLGDMLSGNIHDELAETNDTVIVEATTEMGYILYDMGKLFADTGIDVEMIVIPGNHPRLHRKPRAKKRYDNFEYLMGQITSALAVQTPNLTVKVPKDIIYTHDIMGYKIGMTHGDGSKAASFAGIPFYGLKQRSNASQAMRSRLGLDRHDMLVMGHFHQLLTWMEGDCQIVINGSIKGGDEYGIVSRSSAPEAVQALLTFHKERGWINLAKIPLDHVV